MEEVKNELRYIKAVTQLLEKFAEDKDLRQEFEENPASVLTKVFPEYADTFKSLPINDVFEKHKADFADFVAKLIADVTEKPTVPVRTTLIVASAAAYALCHFAAYGWKEYDMPGHKTV